MGIVEDKVHFTECLFYTDIRHHYHELFEGFTVQHNRSSGIIISDTDSMMQTSADVFGLFGPTTLGFTCRMYLMYRMQAETEHFV